jgi:hypothetical protein
MATKTNVNALQNAQPKALETMISIADLALAHRGGNPRLADIVHTVGAASRCLRIRDLDERLSTENAAVPAIGKKLGTLAC